MSLWRGAGTTKPGDPGARQPCGYLRSTRNTAWVSLAGPTFIPRPGPRAPLAARGWRRAAGRRGARRALGGSGLCPAPAPRRPSARPRPAPGARGRLGAPGGSGSAGGVRSGGGGGGECGVKLEAEASGAPLLPPSACPERRAAVGCEDFPGWRGRPRSGGHNIPKPSRGAEARRLARVVLPGVRKEAQPFPSPSDRRAGLQPPSSLAPRVSGGVRGEGAGTFQHPRSSALWSLEGNRYFSSVFTSGHPHDLG